MCRENHKRWRRLFYRGLLGLSVGFFLVAGAIAQEETQSTKVASLREELEQVRKRIEEEQSALLKLSDSRAKLLAAQKKIAEELREAKKNYKAAEQVYRKLDSEIEALEVLNAGVEERQKQQLLRFKQRLSAFYRSLRRQSQLDLLIRASSAAELLKRGHYLTIIAEHDNKFLQEMSELLAQNEANRLRLSELARVQEVKLEELKAGQKAIAAKQQREQSLLSELNAQTKDKEAALKQYQQSLETLEATLAKLMGGEPAVSEPTVSEPTATSGTPLSTTPAPESLFVGKGLAALRGKLSLPVSGSILRGFGLKQHAQTAERVFVKGLEMRAKQGEQVKVVAEGRVVYAQTLPGYGLVLIVDHGERYYTLYGRLARLLVELGAVVDKGQAVAETGAEDQKGRNFYFELRIKGKAVNPVGFFR